MRGDATAHISSSQLSGHKMSAVAFQHQATGSVSKSRLLGCLGGETGFCPANHPSSLVLLDFHVSSPKRVHGMKIIQAGIFIYIYNNYIISINKLSNLSLNAGLPPQPK